jgi:hypothetical protein
MKSGVVFLLGIVLFAAGLLFALQGSNVVHWPAESFMIGKRDWIEYGVVIAIIGAMLMLTARRIRQ